MKEAVWLFVGKWAMILTILTFAGGMVRQRMTDNDRLDILAGLISAVWWGMWAIGATNVVSDTGTNQYLGLSVIGAAMGAVMLLIALTGTTKMIDIRDVAAD